jgi:cell division protein FtsZ
MPLLDLKSVHGATGVLVHFTGGDDLSLFEVNQAATEISTAAPNAEVIFGATVDPVYTGRAQVILVVTGVETQALESIRPDVAIRRPIQVRAPQPEPAVMVAEPQTHAAAPSGGQLAEALFSQVVPSPTAEARDPSPAATAAQNSLDLPAFLRRRRSSLGETEGNQ